jgi:succinate-acetate transporter protein
MPFFATGTNYSPTGNSLEGQQTESYAASVGAFPHIPLLSLPAIPQHTQKKNKTPTLTRYYHIAFYYVFLALLTFIYLICSIRTNICLFTALFLLVITFALTAGSFFQLANGEAELAHKLQVVSASPLTLSYLRSREYSPSSTK